ncbi:uncharacterized protein B0H18DRAFT_839458, partial [Fomitopsis serialis]|uniref:uncharacterized protein n=1 Tax=Fomitopsis serialis TaxID=139415 RepID=UPI0020077388
MDQLGNYVLPGNTVTYHDKGARQVDVVGKEEKRAYSLLVASTPAGDFLPFQQIWAGASTRVLPAHTAPGMQEALDASHGFDFTFAASNKKTSHFSTLKTMQEWTERILDPYIKRVIAEDPDLPTNQKAIL